MKRQWVRVLVCLFLILLPCFVFAQAPVPPLRIDPFTPHIPARAIAYQRLHRVINLTGIAWSIGGLWLFIRLGVSTRLRTTLYRLLKRPLPQEESTPTFRVLALYSVVFLVIVRLWSLPFGLANRAVEAHYGFGRQSLGGYFADILMGLLLELPLIPLVWGGYWLFVRSPRHWWQWAWGLLTPLLLFQFVIQPVVISPLYNHYTPLPESPLRQDILALASRAGIPETRVFVEDTSKRTAHVNAYVIGLGMSRRIVLNDTGLKELPKDEMLAMVGHEMGHYVEGHIWIFFVCSVFGAGFFLWFLAKVLPLQTKRLYRLGFVTHTTDLAGLPSILLTISLFLLIQYPVINLTSRYLEHRADAFALRVTHLNEAAARLQVGFAERDFIDPDPPRILHLWFGTHPTIKERIEFALTEKE